MDARRERRKGLADERGSVTVTRKQRKEEPKRRSRLPGHAQGPSSKSSQLLESAGLVSFPFISGLQWEREEADVLKSHVGKTLLPC